MLGRDSDWPTMRSAVEALDDSVVSHESKFVSAHRTPDPG